APADDVGVERFRALHIRRHQLVPQEMAVHVHASIIPVHSLSKFPPMRPPGRPNGSKTRRKGLFSYMECATVSKHQEIKTATPDGRMTRAPIDRTQLVTHS